MKWLMSSTHTMLNNIVGSIFKKNSIREHFKALFGSGKYLGILEDFVKIAPHAITKSKNLMGVQFLSHYLTILDIKIIFSLVSNLKKILNLTSDPIIIETLLCNAFLTFIIKLLINCIHKTFLKHSIITGFHTHHF